MGWREVAVRRGHEPATVTMMRFSVAEDLPAALPPSRWVLDPPSVGIAPLGLLQVLPAWVRRLGT